MKRGGENLIGDSIRKKRGRCKGEKETRKKLEIKS